MIIIYVTTPILLITRTQEQNVLLKRSTIRPICNTMPFGFALCHRNVAKQWKNKFRL